MLAPTLRNVRTHRIFANGVELVRSENAANLEEIFAAGNTNLEPLRSIGHK